jgi:hypothetical protein
VRVNNPLFIIDLGIGTLRGTLTIGATMTDVSKLTRDEAYARYAKLMHRAAMLCTLIPDPKSFRDMDSAESAAAMDKMKMMNAEFRAVKREVLALIKVHFPNALPERYRKS